MNGKTIKTLATGLLVGIAAPLIVEFIRKEIKKRDARKKPVIESNTDHGFVSWVGDDDFFEVEGDSYVQNSGYMTLLPLTSKERMMNYPQFKKYQPFSVTPAKKIKIV